jgi:hypothetical protein
MKSIYFILLLLCAKPAWAHQPDLSNFMIYNQNGKYLLVMKSSLTAFEGEIDYHYQKNAYKTPEAFMQLVIKHFEKNCMVVMNNDTVRFINPRVIPGHETTLFAELMNAPDTITSLYVRNTFFKDMPNNMCELILTAKGVAQMQYILNNDNAHAVKLHAENKKWLVEEAGSPFFRTSNYSLWVSLVLIVLILVILAASRKKSSTNTVLA